MPTYDYRCDACEHQFEEFHSITAKPLKKCPQCGKSKLKRLIGTGGGIIFKGSGFYETDYRSEGYKKAAKAESSNGAASNASEGSGGASGGAAKDGSGAKSSESSGGGGSSNKSDSSSTAGKPAPAKASA